MCAIIGNPVAHSLSPLMHNAAFKELGLDFIYVAFNVRSEELKTVISGIKSMGFKGINVTMPHKTAVINYLDEMNSTAKSIGAINTILNKNGYLIGYNTDGNGAMFALEKNGICFKGKKIVLLGAGGAAKAIAYQAAKDVKELIILNRTQNKAKKIAETLKKTYSTKIKAENLSAKILKQEMETTDILINSTTVGMYPDIKKSPIPKDLLHSNLSVMDIIYKPLETKLLKDAKSVGAKVISGLEMLIFQGAIAFKIWTNYSAPIEIMRRELLNHLNKEGINL